MGSLRDNRIFRYDYILIAVILFLTLFGLVTLYSASYLFAQNQPGRFSSGLTPLFSNMIAFLIMIALFIVLAFVKFDRQNAEWLIIAFLIVTFVMNFLPFIPVFWKTNHRPGIDSMRWIVLKKGGADWRSFQPSEMIKVALPLYLAYILNKNRDSLDTFTRGPLPPAVWTFIFCVQVLCQRNFSEAVLIVLTALTVCFISGIRLRWFVLALGVIIGIGLVLIYADVEGRWYQRIANFGRQTQDPTDSGYQITLSLEAIKSGGFWGKGIGQGTLKTRMPEVHGDFVFASFAEESGFLGVLLYLVLIGIFVFICYFVAWKSRNMHTQLLAFGLSTPIAAQTLLNIAVVANVIPTTGVPLPFVSAGGSSLLITLLSANLLISITRQHILFEDTQYAG